MDIIRRIYRRWQELRDRLKRRHYILGVLVHVGSVVVMAFITVFMFTLYILQPYRVDGASMQPTLENDDRLFILRSGKVVSDIFGIDFIPKRGDIVVLESKVNDKKWIKRVIGLPEERIVIKDKIITIYNEEFPAGFMPELNLKPELADFPSNEPVVDRIIGKGEVFVIGDNRLPRQSSDSRGSLGNISLDDIDGTVFVRVVPFAKFHFFY